MEGPAVLEVPAVVGVPAVVEEVPAETTTRRKRRNEEGVAR